MGGIKNKLNNKLSNKTLFKLGSHLVALTKYLSTACFTLVLISTIGLNLYRTYSNDNIETSAIGNSSSGGELATQANIDPASIALSIFSFPSSSTGGNDANLSLTIPQGGGIATGRHTITVETGGSVIGYDLILSSDSEETSLVNSDNVDNEENDSGSIIPTTTGTIASPVQLADKSYGYTLANLDNDSSLANTNIWAGLKPSANPDTIATVNESNLTIGQANTTAHNIYYGVNIQNPVETRAGDYTRQVVYTVVGKIAPVPNVDNIAPAEYPLNNKVVDIWDVRRNLFAATEGGSAYTYNKYQSIWTKVTFSACKLTVYRPALYTTDSGYALCQDGRLYVWGNNNHGQLGISSNESVSADSPIDISGLLSGRIRDVSISSSSIALTNNGRVYTWGSNDDGQLGVGDFNDRLSPTDITESFQLDNDDRVIVACMANLSSFALTNNGRVYTWGSDLGGQLGNGNSASNDQSLPVEITDRFNLDPSLEKIIDLQVSPGSVGGTAHALALTNTGRVFVWGINNYGQLGDGSGGESYPYDGKKTSPVEITGYFNLGSEERVKSILTGKEAASYAITSLGRIFGWGAWYWIRTVQTTPLDITGKLPSSDIVRFASNQPVYALDENGRIYASSNDVSAMWSVMPDPGYISPNTTLTGSNFSNVNNVYIDLNRDDAMQANEQCTDLTVSSDTELTCNVPTDNNIATGDYTMYIETPYNYTTTTFRYENYNE